MKKISLLLFVLMATFGLSHAQYQLFINGDVNNNGTPVPFQPVYIMLQSGGMVYFVDSMFTDSSGLFFYTTTVQNQFPQGVAMASTMGCNGIVMDSSGYWAGNNNHYFSLNTCAAGSGNCTASINIIPIGGGTLAFSGQATGGAPGTIFSYYWDLGDGTFSTLQNPVHTYAPGNYTLCLTVIDSIGNCTDTYCSSVSVTGQPVCDAQFYAVPAGQNSFSFYTDSLANWNATYSWSFGDGTSSSSMIPQHTYANPGTYLVCLTVTDSITSCTDTFCDSVTTGQATFCQAGFTAFNSQSTVVTFANLSFSSNPALPLTYSWSFGDGSNSSQMNPTHVYNAPGVYNVCLYITDAGGCADSSCQTITVGNSGPNCSAQFYYFPSGAGSGSFLFISDSLSNSLAASYSWDFGDGNSSTQANPYHTFSVPGTYLVCLTVTDSGCTNTFCDSVNLGGFPNCQADFSWTSSPSGLYSFTNLSTVGALGSLTYFWDFGDSTFSSLENPTHTFFTPGPWVVCLTIVDTTNGCTSTLCEVILGQNPGQYSINGWAFADSSNMIYDGMAYLIVHDSVSGTLTQIDTANILQNFYHFSNVSPGTYLIKAALLPASPDYANYLPTYLGDELFWSNATSTIVTNSNIFNPPIFLIQGANPGGPGFIGGLISQGANKGPGDPLSDISVLLMHNDGTPSGHTVTDANGEFSFSNLAYGTYKVHVEVPGKESEEWTVVIDGTNATFETANFEVGSTQIHAVGTTAIDQFTTGEVLAVFPIPAREVLNIQVNFSEPVNVGLSLVNMMGQTVAVKTEGLMVGSRELSVDVRNLPQGTYLLRIQADAQLVTRRVLVK